jgi:hypothetical protein
LLYHILLSTGDFAYYRAESHVFDIIVPRFGSLRTTAAKRKMLDTWLSSRLFEVSGLEARGISDRVLSECHSGGDFLRALMESIADDQGVSRWADCTPAHLLFMRQIKRQIPSARFIHIVRDGRDVALSLDKLGWVPALPWDRRPTLLIAGLRWEWVVQRGRKEGSKLGNDYLEVAFEKVADWDTETMARIAEFIDHELNYEEIQASAVGSVGAPNTAFESGGSGAAFKPVGRWKSKFPKEQLEALEGMIGDSLTSLGYSLSTDNGEHRSSMSLRLMRAEYQQFWSLKHWVKAKTPLSRVLTDLDELGE